ncbi:MAG: ABC transporter permease, partial [Candidatus Binataceae bacterium]
MFLLEWIERLGALLLDGIVATGNFVIFLFAGLRYMITPPYKPRLWIRQMRSIGAESLYLIIWIGGFTGMVLGLQGFNTLRRFGSEGALGTVVALILVRELGPVLAALMVAARAGSAMAAEIGSMQATEQVDALSVMAINPVQYLVSPRMLAGIISVPLLTIMFDVIGILGGYLIGVDLMGAPGSS